MRACLVCAVRTAVLHILYSTNVSLQSIQLYLSIGLFPPVCLSGPFSNKIKCYSKVPVRVIKLRHWMEMNGQLHATAVLTSENRPRTC
jgi:hypothetical protein